MQRIICFSGQAQFERLSQRSRRPKNRGKMASNARSEDDEMADRALGRSRLLPPTGAGARRSYHKVSLLPAIHYWKTSKALSALFIKEHLPEPSSELDCGWQSRLRSVLRRSVTFLRCELGRVEVFQSPKD